MRPFAAISHAPHPITSPLVPSHLHRSLPGFKRPGPVRFTSTLLFVAGLLVISGGLVYPLFQKLEKDFLPEEDKGRLFCFMVTPNGSTAEFTDRQLRKMEAFVQEVPEIVAYAAIVAPGFSGPGQATSGILFATLADGKRRSIQEIVNGPGGLRSKFIGQVEGGLAIPNIPKAIGRSFGAPFEPVSYPPLALPKNREWNPRVVART